MRADAVARRERILKAAATLAGDRGFGARPLPGPIRVVGVRMPGRAAHIAVSETALLKVARDDPSGAKTRVTGGRLSAS
jgi:hypothetical protein